MIKRRTGARMGTADPIDRVAGCFEYIRLVDREVLAHGAVAYDRVYLYYEKRGQNEAYEKVLCSF
jgi:hypothetical protein